tara:strand:+ start:43119 stop:44189 length:1071 start_codon:yes stop_codon:yes gene_type:complete
LANLNASIPPVHGGLHHNELSEFCLDPKRILDFSVNINPYGPAPAVLRAARAANLRHYCDPTAADTRDALGTHLEIQANEIALGNGAAELMWSLARLLADPKRPALIVGPTFSEYTSAIRSYGGAVTLHQTTSETGFAVAPQRLIADIEREASASVYLCTPNNPTGTALPMASICELAMLFPKTTFVVDQAFLSLSPQHRDLGVHPTPNMVLLRSLTKDHSIPGLRVAYLIAEAKLTAALERGRPPWTVSAPAQAALLASLVESDFVENCRLRMESDRNYLAQGLRTLGLAPLPSNAPYLVAKVGNATKLRERLLREHQILIRDCTSFAMPEYIRLASRPTYDIDRLLAALGKALP